jgi:hypothetical protein
LLISRLLLDVYLRLRYRGVADMRLGRRLVWNCIFHL